ncbi:hypothetical protein DEU56DRAFT_890245 [Suillus clintonianus]|uniref:uncharacterized protein n=1 Tax=Suillus clintonianus TaxID=1904413 RepID=UPI001B881C74|nr:uncharacterized protein DEU56DRAFT_890245 [Suillus clintonianus]KAG2130259.1 hypothetical protein DEU56DRAFT_890245 [Suillus clintonianus]
MPRSVLPFTHNDSESFICHDNLGKVKKHGAGQRYVSPTSGICRKLVVQAVNPSKTSEVKEVAIKNHTNEAGKLARWLLSNFPPRGWIIFEWITKWLWFNWLLLWPIICSGYYKPYIRRFRGQLWAARSSKEHSSRIREDEEKEIRIRTLYPRRLVIRNRNEWVLCADRDIIIRTKFIAISYRQSDICTPGSSTEREDKAQFTDEVRAAVLGQKFDAYWLDSECLGKTRSEMNIDLYCMADVYRRAEVTLIMLGKAATSGEDECWKSWGQRVWTFPEALLSSRLCYKFRDREEVNPLSLFQLANLAYAHSDDEQAIVNAYGGKDPLERLERLTLLKQAIWRRGTSAHPIDSPPPPKSDMIGGGPVSSGAYGAERVYALMGLFEHRILPSHEEDDLKALARLSMANDNDRIIERMLSMLPSTITKEACWYAENDMYGANLWDIIPEFQVSGVTKSGALVADGCRAATIRWKDFPEVTCATPYSLRRQIVGFMPYLAWPIFIIGLVIYPTTDRKAGIALIIIGLVFLFLSPLLFLYSKSGRIVIAQPWLIGVKGVIRRDVVESHLYGGATKHFPRMLFTPSGSQFSIPERQELRGGSPAQYDEAIIEEGGLYPGHMYTLIDTISSTMYYFRAEKAPTVCIFTGREGGLGRFVLCSENCQRNELHKESVLRMPTEITHKMEMCGWIALG